MAEIPSCKIDIFPVLDPKWSYNFSRKVKIFASNVRFFLKKGPKIA